MKRISFLIIFLHAISALCFSDTIHVPADQPTIQEGIDAAANGDTVLVAPGTYVECIDFLGKAITLKSGKGADVTTIDGGNAPYPGISAVTFQDNEGNDSVLQGFKIVNGTGNWFLNEPFMEASCGGGVFCVSASPMIIDNTIADNTATYGGGVFCYNAAPTIMNNTIKGNYADFYGGGLCCELDSSPLIMGNTISNNESFHDGGGINCVKCIYEFPVISDNTISGNTSGHDHGGGICLSESGAMIINNTICENETLFFGAGICCKDYGPPVMVLNNSIFNNETYYGGGIYCQFSTMTLVNNAIFNNKSGDEVAGGLHCGGATITVVNNTIFGNRGFSQAGNVSCSGSTMTIRNSIIWGGYPSTAPEIKISGSTNFPYDVTISHSNVEGGQAEVEVSGPGTFDWGSGMIDANPMFVDENNYDLHLTYDSSCRDMGDNAVVTELYDFEGDPRIAHGIVDMGFDEFHTHLYCTGDFIPDGAIEGRFIGVPGATPVGLFVGSGIMDPPLQHMWGEFYLEAPWLLFPLIPIPANGVLEIPATLPITPAPYDIPMQALIGWELSNLFVLEVR